MKNLGLVTFRRYLIISALLHLIFIGVFIYGLPSFFEKLPEENQVITFEMVNLADINNIKNQAPKTVETEEVKEAQKIKKSSPPTPPKEEEIEEEKKKEEPQKEETPKPLEKEAEVIQEEKKEIEIPKKEEKKKDQALPKKEIEKEKLKDIVKPKKIDKPKKIVKKPEDPIDSILKNLEKESEGQEIKSPNRKTLEQKTEGKSAKGDFNEEMPLSITEITLIKNQIEDKWNKPVAAANIENIKLILHLKLETDGTVIDVQVKNPQCPSNIKQICDLLVETAIRAAKKASPIKNLRPERYDVWKEFDLRFDPSTMQ